jgi:phenylpropionate dioxygenase-like ring-hydroxylating dioxygenase large terminal subunit
MAFIERDQVSFLGTAPVPTEPYYSEAFFQQEREKIFKRVWLFVGREEELADCGDYVVKDFDIVGASVLVSRDKDGKLGAYYNVCSHRLAKLVWGPHGNAKGFTCKYHGWRYDLNGELRSAPDGENFFDLDARRSGLLPIHLDVWNGFVFINFDNKPRQSLAEFLAPISAKLSEHSYEGFGSHVVLGSEVEVNWKCILDNFQETYHLSFVHNLSVGDRSVGGDNPLGHPLSFEFFGPHRLMGVWGNPQHKPATVEGIAVKYGGVISAGATQQTERHKNLRHPNWQLDVHGIFPNLLIDVAPTFFFIHEFVPISPARTRWFTRVFFPTARSAAERFSQEYSVAAFRDTVAEDMAVLSTQQASMLSGARDVFQFQMHEAMCRHSIGAVQAYVQDERNELGLREVRT